MKRFAVLLLLLPLLACTSGCGALIAERFMDKATDNMIKLMEAEARLNKERRAESYLIEGRFESLSMVTRDVPEEDPDKVERKQEGNKVTVTRPTRKVTTCVVTFADGREKAFRNVPPRELERGKKYVIKYNGLDEIVEIQESEPKS